MAAKGDSKPQPEKTECIHPGKDPKCGNCPDREENKTQKKSKSKSPKKAEAKSPKKDKAESVPSVKVKEETSEYILFSFDEEDKKEEKPKP